MILSVIAFLAASFSASDSNSTSDPSKRQSLLSVFKVSDITSWIDRLDIEKIEVDFATFNNILEILGRLGKKDETLTWYARMTRSNTPPNILSLTKILRACTEARDMELSSTYVEEVKVLLKTEIDEHRKSSHVAPQVLIQQKERFFSDTYNLLINCLSAFPDKINDAAHLYTEMVQLNLAPSQNTMNTILEALGNNNRVDDALLWLNKTVSDGIKPNLHTFFYVFSFLEKAGRAPEALSWYDNYVKTSGEIPSLTMVHFLLEKFIAEDKLELAISRLDSFKSLGVVPEVSTYNTIIQALSKEKRVEDAQIWFDKIRAVGLEPDITSYNLILLVLGDNDRITKANQWMEKMAEKEVPITVAAWNSILRIYEKNDKIDRLVELFSKMKERGGVSSPDTETYNIVINVHGKNRKLEKAREWYNKMESEGIQPNSGTFKVMADACEKSGKKEEAKTWRDKIENKDKTILS